MMITINGKTAYTLGGVSRKTGYTVRTIQEYARRHKLGFRFNGNRYYAEKDIEFLRQLRKK
jgi:DNA-binding transcriptional MerR regulator